MRVYVLSREDYHDVYGTSSTLIRIFKSLEDAQLERDGLNNVHSPLNSQTNGVYFEVTEEYVS